MKVKLGDLRQAIQEEFLRGVPEFMLRDITSRYMESIKNMLERHIEMTSIDPTQTREKMDAANEVMKSLEEDVYQVLEDKLWQFMQRT